MKSKKEEKILSVPEMLELILKEIEKVSKRLDKLLNE